MKVLLINDTENHYHWGCTGTSLAIKEQIQKFGFDLNSITIRETKAWQNVPKTRKEFESESVFSKFCVSNPKLIEQIKETDILVINGEGTIHGGLRQGPTNLLYVAYIAKIYFKKNVQIINHQVYLVDFSLTHPIFLPNQSLVENQDEAREIYSMVYANLDFVAIRDPISFQQAKDWNPTTTLAFDCLPLYIKNHYSFQEKTKKNNQVLVVGGSVAWEEQGMPAFAEYLKEMASHGHVIQVLIGAKTDPSEDDKLFVKCLGKYLEKTPWELINADSMELWLDTIRHANLVVSGRFHYTIAAACLETRFIVLNSNTLKNHALSQWLRIPPPLCYLDPDLFQQLMVRTTEMLKTPITNNYMGEFCQAAENNFNALAQLKKNSTVATQLESILDNLNTSDSSLNKESLNEEDFLIPTWLYSSHLQRKETKSEEQIPEAKLK